LKTEDIREMMKDEYKNKNFVIDKSNVNMIELVGITYNANEKVIFGTLNMKYAKREVEWYESQSLNVYDLPKTPKIWRQISDKDGYINSNYGYIIYSKENSEQYKNCLRTLRKDKNSRRAMMIYTRPSIQHTYNKKGMSDFICTNSVQCLIRDDKLHYILNQRSCDAIYGAKNDLHWAKYIQLKLVHDLNIDYPNLKIGQLIHQVGSLHIYERHFNLLKE
jgi:thymidylate synthase